MIEKRREEIIHACEELYQTRSFREITLKEIGRITKFSRPTIYNYFHSKEEIFLALFKREYDRWNEALQNIRNSCAALSRAELADRIARSLQDRRQLLRLLCMNSYDMEENSRLELLRQFKESYGASMESIRSLLTKFCPEMSAQEKQDFIYTLYPFMFGIFPYAEVTEKQRTAMREAGVDYEDQSIYALTRTFLLRLLGADETGRTEMKNETKGA